VAFFQWGKIVADLGGPCRSAVAAVAELRQRVAADGSLVARPDSSFRGPQDRRHFIGR